jgi:hypothetical protein
MRTRPKRLRFASWLRMFLAALAIAGFAGCAASAGGVNQASLQGSQGSPTHNWARHNNTTSYSWQYG